MQNNDPVTSDSDNVNYRPPNSSGIAFKDLISLLAIIISAIALFQSCSSSRNEVEAIRDQIVAYNTGTAKEIQASNTRTAQQIQMQATVAAEQNQTVRDQTEIQYQQQQQIYLDTQRVALLETIYARRDCEQSKIENCAFLSSVKVRAEAVIAYVRILDPLNRVNWKYVDRSNCKADFVDIDLRNVNLEGANIEDAELSGTDLTSAMFNGADLDRVFLDNAKLIDAQFKEADLWGAKLRCAKLWRANFTQADLRNADLRDAEPNGIILTSAKYSLETQWPDEFDYQNSNAIGPCANLTGVDLTEADLTNADLHNAILTGTDLENTDISGAKFTEDTVWPDGFNPIEAGAIKVQPMKCN